MRSNCANRRGVCRPQPQGGGKDVFVHISAVERAGLSTLNEGAVIEYEIVSNKGKDSAEKHQGKAITAPPNCRDQHGQNETE
jgi:cold shock CspA family protein